MTEYQKDKSLVTRVQPIANFFVVLLFAFRVTMAILRYVSFVLLGQQHWIVLEALVF